MRFGIGILLRRDGDVVPVEDEVWEMSIPYDAGDDGMMMMTVRLKTSALSLTRCRVVGRHSGCPH